ncbi:hypothetical protein ACFLTJ_00440 [Chloroflexota bacterium]
MRIVALFAISLGNYELSYFGASIVHKRRAFSDPATASRTIIIRIRNNPGSYHVNEIGQEVRDGLKQLWLESAREPVELEYSGRAADVWAPLITVAAACGDIPWCGYAFEQVENATHMVRLGQDFEPEMQIVNALIALYTETEGAIQRIRISDVKNELRREYNWQPSSWAIADQIRGLEIEVKDSHGRRVAVVDKVTLQRVCRALAMDDPWGRYLKQTF